MIEDPAFRLAQPGDLDALVALEKTCFEDDRISRRSFRRFLEAPGDRLVIAEADGILHGYALVLMHKATRLARIYSIAVAPAARGKGLGEKLIRQAEALAAEAGRIVMRLEVRTDNPAAIALYRRLGYRQFGTLKDYYADHGDALRFERRILFSRPGERFRNIPYYAQTTDFSCGPAALMMALATLQDDVPMSTHQELRIWREATTIYMLSGHGGCGPHGLALAAWSRGFHAEIQVSRAGPLFLDTVRNERKKDLLRLVHEDFLLQLADTAIPIRHEPLYLAEMEAALEQGRIPIMLISTWQLNRSRVPHWVTLCAIDDQFVYIHDPDVDMDVGETVAEKQYLPIDRKVFESMARYGSQVPLQAAVIIGPARAAATPDRVSV
ncbi:GNAT family N-acetyltransferase/peptidase C39 family protein [Hydrocarboniclastica marina]|uniref:GNAT family N-acetyltransferase/peptidase C39 family protein n=1 Tax=Hydrocarboniclastica marina TaxID=2259620 RepID=UPI001FE9BF14|nr:GNAT family N-acetyltransferase/peptidase C39 family protein [Hydrocarboniclastica marina]